MATNKVAPHVGAWIETDQLETILRRHVVAPHVGAWIETFSILIYSSRLFVAPHVGAWIETNLHTSLVISRRRSPCGSVD